MSSYGRLKTAEELRLLAKAFGRPVTAVQFESWRKRGLIPSPVRRFCGRGTGSETLGYPDHAFLHVMAVASALRHKRSLDNATWWMWLAGHDVTDAAHRMLKRKADAWHLAIEHHLQTHDADLDCGDINTGSGMIWRLVWRRGPKWLSPFRRHFRGHHRDEYETIIYMVLEALSGRTEIPVAWRNLLGDEVAPFRRALGIRATGVSDGDQESEQRECVEFWLKQLWKEMNARLLADEMYLFDEVPSRHEELDDLRDQFIYSLVVMWRKFGTSLVPITPAGFLLWFAVRFMSTKGSWLTFGFLRPILDSENKTQLRDLIQREIRNELLFPKIGETDERIQRLFCEEH